ncbi:endo alpha-1,4 polygalactosaminidase [Nitrosovibrio tenuis]|nr:endo alpha-1,4 polygalactosaminidase [Nitrosovibrio tenuis]
MTSAVSADVLEQRDIAFYYGSRPPVDDLRHFDQIVIQPSQVLPHEKAALLKLDSLIFAYVSFGEIARNSEDMPRIKTSWSIGVNPAWNSLVMNMNDPGWHEYLLEHHFARLWREGYRAFFLDTVDSYLIVTAEGKQREEQETGLVALLAEVKRRFPGCKLILNRGFEVLDRASQYADGMVAESLFHGFDPVTGKHAPTKEENRTWLLNQLSRAQNEFKVPVTVLDYVEPGNWAEAEKTAREIVKLGFMPWVANGDLTWLGQGRLRLAPRKLLAIVNGSPAQQMDHELFRHAAMPLEYLGLALDYWYIDQLSLPIEPLVGRYAGVIAWLGEDSSISIGESSTGRYESTCARLKAEVDAGLPMVFMGHLPAGDACRNLIDYQGELQPTTRALKLGSAGERLGRPNTAPVVGSGTPDIRVRDRNEAWLTLSDGDKLFHPVAVGAWGGYALHPHILSESASGRREWLLDPFSFFQAALRLPAQPVFDLTTENGRRLGIIEVRGDRLFEKDEHGVEAIDRLRAWVERNGAPVTLGVIEAEADNEERRSKVRHLASMPQVRLASHTYSHPFYWGVFEGKTDANQQPYRYSVFMDGYAADITRETEGTVEFLKSMAPDSPLLLIWSGDGRPGPAALAATHKGGLPHYGGGGLRWQSGSLSLADLSPALRPTEWGTQILTPLTGEPLFAQLWYGEALNFGKISEWNRQLDSARRLRISSISVHADALLHARGMELLDALADEQRKENTLSIWVDEYVTRARAFQTASVARDLNGNWMLFGDALRTVRLPASEMLPEISTDVVGYSDRNSDRYIYLARNHAILKPRREGQTDAPVLRLLHASAPLKSWHLNADGTATILFEPRGDVTLAVPASCLLSSDGEMLSAVRQGSHSLFNVSTANASGEFRLEC